MKVNINEAKTHLSRLLERVAMGEEVIIANAGNPVAKLVPIQGARPKFHFGSAEGEFLLPEDFNGTLPKDAEDLFWK
jgi:prevent-host-death family protein